MQTFSKPTLSFEVLGSKFSFLLSVFFHFWSFSLSMSLFPFVVLFVELASIIAEFSSYCQSCDRNWS